MAHSILFVDDEKNVLSSLKRAFFNDDYKLLFALSGEEGLGILKETAVSIIVSDMRMPNMNGVEFLKKARDICPDAIRMVLSGYSDIDTIMEAVNHGHIWRYITKPWNDNDLRLSIMNSIEFYEQSMERKRLLLELEEKNKRLNKMNEILEKKVEERTWQLKDRTDILNMLVEDADIESIISKSLSAISRQTGGNTIFVMVPFLEKTFSNTDEQVSDFLKKLGKESIAKNRDIFENDVRVLPLTKGDSVLGALIVCCINENEIKEHVNTINSFSSLISLSLSQQKSLKDAPDLLKNIDNIMGDL